MLSQFLPEKWGILTVKGPDELIYKVVESLAVVTCDG
jgi:hypothetical protein